MENKFKKNRVSRGLGRSDGIICNDARSLGQNKTHRQLRGRRRVRYKLFAFLGIAQHRLRTVRAHRRKVALERFRWKNKARRL